MDDPFKDEMTGEVRNSPKLSRRKKSRPVKFNQDFVMTDISGEFDHSPTEVSSVTCSSPGNGFVSYEGSPLSMEATHTPEDFGDQDELSQASSADMIHRTIPSIRDSPYHSVGNPNKKIKVEVHDVSEPEQNQSQQETDTTCFSSLLHTFASQVTKKVDQAERRSPYREQTANTIWTLQGQRGSPSPGNATKRKVKSASPPQSKQASTSAASSQAQQDVSFSGMLKTFVSHVTDSQQKEASVETPALMALLQNKGKPSKSIPITVGSECRSESDQLAEGTQSAYSKDSQSFAGLLHSFASVVDKEGQGPSQATTHKNFLSVDRSGEREQKTSKSLLDVLHDAISRRVMESSPSPPPPPSQDPRNQLVYCKEMFGNPSNMPSSSKQIHVGGQYGANATLHVSPQKACVDHEPQYDLHPSGQQWSHIRNVLPPLDAEDDTAAGHQDQEGAYSHDEDVGKRCDESPTGSTLSHSRQLNIKEEPVDNDFETEQAFTDQENQVRVKMEPVDYSSSSTCDPAGQGVTSTLRERLLSRIESRQSPLMKSPHRSSYSPVIGDMVGQHFGGSEKQGGEGANGSLDMPTTDGLGMQEQPQLVSQLLNNRDSLQWRNIKKCNGSFADLLNNITSTMLVKDDEKHTGSETQNLVVKQEPQWSYEEQPSPAAQSNQSSKVKVRADRPATVRKLLQSRSSSEETAPHGNFRIHSGSQASQATAMSGVRAQKLKVLSYAEPPSASSTASTSSEEVEQRNIAVQPRSKSKQLHSLSPRSRHSALMKQRLKRSAKFGLKLSKGWPRPAKRREDSHHGHNEMDSPKSSHQQYEENISSTSQSQPADVDTSFTDLLQKLAQKCQAGTVEAVAQRSPMKARPSLSPAATASSQQSEHHALHGQQEPRSKVSVQSSRAAERASSASLRNLLTQRSTLAPHPHDDDPTSDSLSASAQLGDVSFANLMQDMASTVKQNENIGHASCEDLSSLDPPSSWLKSVSGNWLRFLHISPDENPRVTMSVAINLWNGIHELKIHCHHLEVPVNHWIFRRFGKRIHTKAALMGVLQAISQGCSVCEGTTRSDLVQMFRNKLAQTSRWQAAAVLEDSFGATMVRSKQCELLVSGLRRSREKRCSKCSMYVDRKLKAVMYHMRKKLGILV